MLLPKYIIFIYLLYSLVLELCNFCTENILEIHFFLTLWEPCMTRRPADSIPLLGRKTNYGQRIFDMSGQKTWNRLPPNFRNPILTMNLSKLILETIA